MEFRASNVFSVSSVRPMFFSSYTASSSVWKPRKTQFLKRSASIFAQFSSWLEGISST